MDPFLVTQLAEQHHRDLVGLAQAEHGARRARQGTDRVRPWRHALAMYRSGRALRAAQSVTS